MPQTSFSSLAWEWKEKSDAASSAWRPCRAFPTTIHQELLAAGLIPDPDVGFHELDVQWVGERDWLFRTAFRTPAVGPGPSMHAVLALDGLDTVAEVSLNGQVIGRSDNMFVPLRIPVDAVLLPEGGLNELEILFESPVRVSRALKAKHVGPVEPFSAIGDSSRLYLRKAQYHWGWDWGPIILTCGPYKDIRLECYHVRIEDMHADVQLSDGFARAEVTVRHELDTFASEVNATLHVQINCPEGAVLEKTLQPGELSADFTIDSPQLWWPAGDGAQPLYKATTSLFVNNVILSSRSTSFGIRRVELIQKPLSAPADVITSFYFQINGRPTLALGSNWIPASSFLPRVDDDLYDCLLNLARRGNTNMLRIWGGGCYEDDRFYELCDRLGIMVWQDFMFACGDYPVFPPYLDSVATEVACQVRRLRNHPSVVLWCGNNEDIMFAQMLGKKVDISNVTGPWPADELPHRHIYFKLIPDMLARLCPGIPYHPTSPFGGAEKVNDPTVGDLHMWQVYHGTQRPYQDYPELVGSFVSEFGMHAFPDIRTVAHFAPDSRSPQTREVDFHNKGRGGERRLGTYLSENFRVNWSDMDAFVYATQLLQSEALGYALRHWRRAWAGPGRERCGGMLIWQFNDVYPTTSWSTVDSFLRPKAAFYSVARHFAQHAVGIARTPAVASFAGLTEAPDTRDRLFEVWGANSAATPKDVVLHLRLYDFATQSYMDLPEGVEETKTYTLRPNQSTELVAFHLPGYNPREGCHAILAATLSDVVTGSVIARDVSWPEPFRYLDWPRDTHVDATILADGRHVALSSNYPIKGVKVSVDPKDGEDAVWEDNMVDLMPGEELVLGVDGLDRRAVRTQWLYSWEQ